MGCRSSVVFGCCALALLFCFIFSAPSSAFLYVERNQAVPDLVFSEFPSHKQHKISSTLQRPLVLVFWGAEIDTKKERAIEVLSDIQNNRQFYREHNVDLAAIYVQPENAQLIEEVASQTKIDFPILLDDNNESFEKIGVYVMPSILVVKADGIIHAALSYTRNLNETLPGEIEVMLGEKTREELNSELHPEIIIRSTAQRRARLDYNYAMNLVQRQRIDAALDKLDLSLENNPDFIPAIVEKGCLLVKKKKFEEAEKLLSQGEAMLPGYERALTCKAELKKARSAPEEKKKGPTMSDPSSWGRFTYDDEDEDLEE